MLQQVFDSAQLAVTDQVKSGLTFRAVQGRRKQFMAVSFDLNKIFYTYPFLVPDYFALITRAMIVLEGIAVTGDPEFDLFKVNIFSINLVRTRWNDKIKLDQSEGIVNT